MIFNLRKKLLDFLYLNFVVNTIRKNCRTKNRQDNLAWLNRTKAGSFF